MSDTTAKFLIADALHLPFADQQFDAVIGSPPYCDARTYGIGAQRDCAEWVDWMLGVTTEALRVSKGAVIWVAAGVTRQRSYWPACEGLMYEWWRRGGSMLRPCFWHRIGVPGSGGNKRVGYWFKSNVEYVMCFKRDGSLPYFDLKAIGHKPKYRGGGACTNYRPVWTDQSVRIDGRRRAKRYAHPEIANPGNLIDTGVVGGGHMGDAAAKKSEAAFPEALVRPLILSLVPPGGTVLDPFSGSGTTVATALKCGRSGVGTDIRESQIEIGRKRVGNVTRPFDFVAAPAH